MAVCQVGQSPDLLQRVEGAELGGLRDADGAGLGVMLKAEAVKPGFYQFGCELAVRCRHREQAAACNALRRAALVDVDVCRLGAHHGMVRATHGIDVQYIGACAVEHEIDTGLLAEFLLDELHGTRTILVVAVCQRMVDIGRGYCLHDFRADA